MRILFLFIIFALTHLSASAETNSWKKTCRSAKGSFVELKDGEETLPSCIFGESVVGAEALHLFKSDGVQSESIRAYKEGKNGTPRGGVCGAFEADLVTAKDRSGHAYNLCRFSDHSFMEETTLWLGPGSLSSEVMDESLLRTIRAE